MYYALVICYISRDGRVGANSYKLIYQGISVSKKAIYFIYFDLLNAVTLYNLMKLKGSSDVMP